MSSRPGSNIPRSSAPLEALAARGLRVDWVAPDESGCVPVGDLEAAITAETRLVTVIWANNETGAIQPIAALAAICRARGIWLHADATQAIGKLEIDLAKRARRFDRLLGAQAGRAEGRRRARRCATRRRSVRFLLGGGQERGRRGGTENVIGIAGFGAACRVAAQTGASPRRGDATAAGSALAGHRDASSRACAGTATRRARCRIRSTSSSQAVAGEVLLQALDLEGVSVSAGAACHSGSIEPSKVLLAMGRTPASRRGGACASRWASASTRPRSSARSSCSAKLVPRIRALGEP